MLFLLGIRSLLSSPLGYPARPQSEQLSAGGRLVEATITIRVLLVAHEDAPQSAHCMRPTVS
jgi:hypothetical protein